MNETFATIIYSAPKMDVEELMKVRSQLSSVLDEKFVHEIPKNPDLVNRVIRENIDFKKPTDGEIGLRLFNLAKERNVNYTPSSEMLADIRAHCSLKCMALPPGLGGGEMPQYQP